MGSKTESLSQIVHPVLSIVYLGRITNALSSTLVYGYRMQTLEEIKAVPGPRGLQGIADCHTKKNNKATNL
jgi:hypothetical protein